MIPEDEAAPLPVAPGKLVYVTARGAASCGGGGGSQHSSDAEVVGLRHARFTAGPAHKDAPGSSATPTKAEAALLDGVSAKAQGGRSGSSASPRSLDVLDLKARRPSDGRNLRRVLCFCRTGLVLRPPPSARSSNALKCFG